MDTVRSGLLGSLLLVLATSQALRDWMAQHMSDLSQALPFVMSVALQSLATEATLQQDAIHRARRLLQLKKSTGVLLLLAV